MKTTDRQEPVDQEGKSSARRRRIALLFVISAILLAGAGTVFVIEKMRNRVHEIDVTQLASIKIQDHLLDVNLDIHPQLWSQLVDNFESSMVNFSPSKWMDLATVTFAFKDGEQKVVHVFATGKQPGCFRIGKLYYTGGDERALIRLMDDQAKRQKKSDKDR